MKIFFIFIFLLPAIAFPQAKKQSKKATIENFTLHFYRLRLDPTITVKRVFKKDHFYVAEGQTENIQDLVNLSRKLLNSKTLSQFELIDSLVHLSGDKFKIFMKTKNIPKRRERAWIMVNPIPRFSKLKKKEISGSCFPNDRRIKFTGDFNGFTQCKKGTWKMKIPSLAKFPSFIFVHISDFKNDAFFDGVSLNAKNFQ